MRIGSTLLSLLRPREARPRPSKQRTSRRRAILAAERLGVRRLLSNVSLLSASTADSRGVTIAYDVAAPGAPDLDFGVYRSATADFGPSARPVKVPLELPELDAAGRPTNGPGLHEVTIPIPGGLPINPSRPFVLVVADPDSPTAGQPGTVASFRKRSIAVVTHGGIQHSAWKKHGPPWTHQMARSLRDEGYDKVIAFNWAPQSNTPGQAAKQAPRLARMVRKAATRFPDGDPVDLHFIGHSEGAVVNTLAIVRVARTEVPGTGAGYLEDTLLDPHAANPGSPGQKYSTSGPLGWIAKLAIDSYESEARDPLVFIPDAVDSAKVFYQQTPAHRDHGTNSGIYNLWGQVPVKGDADYFNLTQAGVVHSGKQGMAAWYQRHIVPTLGDGAPGLASTVLATSPDGPTIVGGRATYTGTGQADADLRLSAAKGRNTLRLVAKTVVEPDGTWTATTRPLPPGTYRVIAETKAANWTYKSRRAIPTSPLGALVIGQAVPTRRRG